MLRLTITNLRAHKRRLAATFAAVVLGVAFLVGVLVQTQSLQHGFDLLFDAESAQIDAVVRSASSVSDGDDVVRARIDPSVLDAVRATPGVATAEADVRGTAVIVGKDGKELGSFGPPRVGMTWIDDPNLTPWRLASGRVPATPEEVVIDVASAEAGDLAVGDETTVLSPDPVEVTVVGTARFGTEPSQGTTTATFFSASGAAAHLAGGSDQIDRVLATAEPGTSQEQLVEALAPAVPTGGEAITGEVLRVENRESIAPLMDFLRPALLAFALIALLVAAFSIYNTFAILVAQRSREAALLRAIGASRAQTLRSVLFEALLVGAVASAVGVVAGIGIAALLGVILGSAGLDLAGPMVMPATVLVGSAALGTAITVVCAVGPAIRASRIAPMAALRETAVDRSGTSRARLVAGTVLAATGIALVTATVVADQGMALAGIGFALTVVSLGVLAPLLAAPVGRTIGWPLRLRGITGDLARENAIRNPRRTASSSTALLVGVAVVALFTVFGASVQAGLSTTVDRGFGADLMVTSKSGPSDFDPVLSSDIQDLPEVTRAAGLGGVLMTFDGSEGFTSTSDVPEAAKLIDLDVAEGDLDDVVGSDVAISTELAEANGWTIGSEVPYQLVGRPEAVATVRATYKSTTLAGDHLMSAPYLASQGADVLDDIIVVELAPGVSPDEGRTAVEAAVADRPSASVLDREEFKDLIGSQINQVLVVVYGMLGLSILIALIGIANTLSLSIFERTRELGLLRAVGQVRGQTRAMVRWESVIIAVFGTLLGLAVGIAGAWVLITASGGSEELAQFSIPVGQMAVVVLLGAAAGVVASLRPASRAAKLDPLTAIAAS